MARLLNQRIASTSLAAALLVAIATPVLAQPAPAAAPAAATAPAPADGAQGPRHQRAHSPEQFKERMAQRAAQLKQKLQLTPAQEPAWTAFTTAMQPPAGPRHAKLDRKEMDQLTTPERIDRMRALRAQRSAEMDRRDEAVKTFYAALTPAQQKTFDAEARRMHPRMDGGPGHRGADGEPGKHGRPGKPAAPAASAAPQ